MVNIDISSWKEFRIGDLFDIHPTASYKKNNNDIFCENGKTPVLSNSNINNGVGGYSDLKPTEQGNIITFSDTTTGANTMFYQKVPFIGYSHVQGMYPKGFVLTENIALFLISAMQKAFGDDFNYANKFNRKIVAETTILLPAKEIDEPDWDYMSELISELEEERISELNAYLEAAGLDDYELTEEEKVILSLSEKSASNEADAAENDCGVRMKEYNAMDFFELLPVKHKLSQENLCSNGLYPAYSSESNNNGIIGYTNTFEFVTNEACPYFVLFGDHTRTMNIVETCFSVLDNVKVLMPKIRNKKSLLYLITWWRKQIPNNGYARHWKHAQGCKVFLPITSDNTPDWDYMEKYIRAIEKQTIADVVKYKDNFIAMTKNTVREIRENR